MRTWYLPKSWKAADRKYDYPLMVVEPGQPIQVIPPPAKPNDPRRATESSFKRLTKRKTS